MKIVGMMPARNEDWVIGLSLRVALVWCDQVIVFDHASTDRTAQIVDDVMSESKPGAVVYCKESAPDWDEMGHRNAMLAKARSYGATHLAIVDADEILTGNLLQPMDADVPDVSAIRAMVVSGEVGTILQLPGYNLRNSIGQYHSNGVWGKRIFSLAFCDDPRLKWPEDRFHCREPKGMNLRPYYPLPQGSGGIMHLWGASYRRLVAKHALYKLTERIKWPQKDVALIDREYSQAIHGRGIGDNPAAWDYKTVPEGWWLPYRLLAESYLDVDAEPWQEAEVRRIVKETPALVQGLDLFGVA